MDHGLFIVGAGGHASVITDILLLQNSMLKIVFIDQFNPAPSFMGFPIFNSLELAKQSYSNFKSAIAAIGDNLTRKQWCLELLAANFELITITHPHATISKFCSIEPGSVIVAGAIVGPGCHIGMGSIINSGSLVEHDASIGAFSHLGPGSIIEARSKVPDLTWIKSGQIFNSENK